MGDWGGGRGPRGPPSKYAPELGYNAVCFPSITLRGLSDGYRLFICVSFRLCASDLQSSQFELIII